METRPDHTNPRPSNLGTNRSIQRPRTRSPYKRTDDKTDPRHAKLEKVSERVNTKGHVTVLNNTGIHKVDNVSQNPALSIHVYGRDIGKAERHSYDPLTGEVSRFVSGYCNVLRDDEPY